MSKKTRIIIFIAVIFFVLAIGVGIFVGYHEAESGNSTSSSYPFSLLITSWLPLFVVFAMNMNPLTPVQNAVNILSNKKLTAEKKGSQLDYSISKNFKTSDAYTLLLGSSLEKSKKIEVKEKGTEKQIISAVLINGEEYEFEVVKRTKENALAGLGQWLVNDCRRI